jgi:hypothetical protein
MEQLTPILGQMTDRMRTMEDYELALLATWIQAERDRRYRERGGPEGVHVPGEPESDLEQARR